MQSPEDQISSEQNATGDELVGDSSSIFVNSSDNEEYLQQISVNHIVHKRTLLHTYIHKYIHVYM